MLRDTVDPSSQKADNAEEPKFRDVKLRISPSGVAVVELARPTKSNSFTLQTLSDLREVILKGEGRNFCAGIDIQSLGSIADFKQGSDDAAVVSEKFRRRILEMQGPFDAIERCRWPVIAAVQGACIGGGLDMIAACDIRLCSEDAVFVLKEVDLAITADLGSLQRLPHIIGHGATMELALTARRLPAAEAAALGFVSRVMPDVAALNAAAADLAALLAAKPAGALTGTKRVLLHARTSGCLVPATAACPCGWLTRHTILRDCSVQQSLEYVATWNGGRALSTDLQDLLAARKRAATRSRL